MPEIFQIYAQVFPRCDSAPNGRAVEAWYTLQNDVVTMCDPEGIAIRDTDGDKITHKLEKGETAQKVAGRLALKIFHAIRDDMSESFNRPLTSRSYQWRVPY